MSKRVKILSSAYSDDGELRQRSRTDENLTHTNHKKENDMAASVTANISEHRVRQRNDDAIYEMPDEDERVSSPPDSLSHQDIKSEHINSKVQINRFSKPKFA